MIYIRTDSNKVIASGHVMRCIAIAEEIKRLGERVTFIFADDNSVPLLEGRGFNYVVLNSEWNNTIAEIPRVIDILRSDSHAVLLADSYYISNDYLKRVSEYAQIAYLGSKQEDFSSADVLINYSNVIDFDFYKHTYSDAKTRLCLGAKYAPLRAEFRGSALPPKQELNKVLVTVGNTDNTNFLLPFVRCVKDMRNLHNIEFHIIAGRFNSYKDDLKTECDAIANVTYYESVNNMSDVMRNSDLAISAAGSTLYELCALGIPTICVSVCGEQDAGAKRFMDSGIMPCAGLSNDNQQKVLSNIFEHMNRFIDDYNYRLHVSKGMKNYVDGRGSMRIAEELLKLGD